MWAINCFGIQDPNDLPNRTIARSECCGPTCKGSVPHGTLNQVFLQTITPSDLKCYPYDITKPGTYVITRDFLHVVTLDGSPLIRVLSSNVTIDFQTFSLYQNVPAGQLDGTDPLLKSNMIEIGNGTDAISNVTLVNGTLSGAAGVGVLIRPNVSNVTINSCAITNCIGGGVAVSGAQNVNVECCSITNHANQNIIESTTDLIIPLIGNTPSSLDILDATLFPLTGSTHLGAFGVLAYNTKQFAVKDSEILACGATNLENDAIGIYAENCNDIEVVRSVSSSHNTAAALTTLTGPAPQLPALEPGYLFAKGMFFKNCQKGFVDCCLVNCNKGSGVVGIDLIESDMFHISNSNILDNSACGDWFTVALPDPCPGPKTDFDLFTRCSLCDNFADSGTNVNLGTAYTDYKVGLTLPQTTPSCISNWQTLIDSADWTTFMEGWHAIDYALEYYTNGSRAYGIRLFATNYVTIDGVSVLDTVSENNSAWGILVDRNICNSAVGAGGLCNIIKFSKVLGTRSFSNTTGPNVTYTTEIEALFGDILDEGNGEAVRRYESISMIGRAVGIELRNCVECTVLHSNLIKGNFSEWTFAAGVFLNRSNKSDLVGNRIECNCGSDSGYGLLNRTVNPTDLTASTTLFANGLMDRSNLIDPVGGPANPPFYPEGTSTIDKNIHYGVFWSNMGVFAVKHAFTSDLGLLNNIGTHENIQIFFDAETQPNVPCTITMPDVDSDYVAP